MVKAVFIDFYGTIVHEDGAVIKEVCQEIVDTGVVQDKSQIDAYWWQEFQAGFMNAHGNRFKTQRVLEYESLAKTIAHFQSTADVGKLSDLMFAHWVKPPIFEESKQFFEECPVPIYIVSNIDRADVLEAIAYHELKPAGVFTSEDARSYKPRAELFELALNQTGLKAEEVVHIGDSMSSDVKGASALGIEAIWLNRGGREIPEGVVAVNNLMEVNRTILSDMRKSK